MHLVQNKAKGVEVKTSSAPIIPFISKYNKNHNCTWAEIYSEIDFALFDMGLYSCLLLSYSREYKDIS